MKQKNVLVSFWKLIFAYQIALGHFGKTWIFMGSGVLVNCFFIISGFFLVQSFESGKYESAWNYTYNRVKKLYPMYIILFSLLFVFVNLIENKTTNIMKIFSNAYNSLPEVLMIQNIGISDGGINHPLWYISVLIVISHILFALLKYNKNLATNIICPIVFILGAAYYFNVLTIIRYYFGK